MVDILLDPNQAQAELERAANVVLGALRRFDGDRQLAPRLRSFTSHLEPSVEQRLRGRVKFYDVERGFGFIEAPGEKDVFVHASQLKHSTQHFLSADDFVEFDVRATEKGPEALEVTLISSER